MAAQNWPAHLKRWQTSKTPQAEIWQDANIIERTKYTWCVLNTQVVTSLLEPKISSRQALVNYNKNLNHGTV